MFTLLMVCLSSSLVNATTLPLTPNESHQSDGEKGDLLKIKFHYEKGHRNSEGKCVERGFCELVITIEGRMVNPGDLDGDIMKDANGNVLLIIEKGGLSTDVRIDITGFAQGPGVFMLSNNSDLPNNIKSQLGVTSEYQFKAGNYQVTETATTYVVNFGK